MSKPEKRDEIVRSSLELIAEHGFHGAPMAMIAEHSKVAAGTIYRYFESKDVLIKELYRDLEKRMYPVILDGYDSDGPIRARFIHLGTALLKYFIENPLDFRFLEQYHNSPYGIAHRRDKLLGEREKGDVFRDLFMDGVAQQVLKEFPLAIQFGLAFGPLLSIARDHILGFSVIDDDLIKRVIEACWDAVKR
jgi:AcrR family transcriptional regulator